MLYSYNMWRKWYSKFIKFVSMKNSKLQNL